MTSADKLEGLRYPIGRFTIDPEVTPAKRVQWIERIAALPAELAQGRGRLERCSA